MTSASSVTLKTWAGRLGARGTALPAKTLVTGLADDARDVREGDLFFARRGTRADGRTFAQDALDRGAVALVCEDDAGLPAGTVSLKVPSVDLALEHAADLFYGRPQDALRLIGITGTKGKTTTAWLAAHALRRLGVPTAVLGTIHHDLGEGGVEKARNTTPGLLEIRALLARARDAGCRAAVLEVSSHALDQGRTRGLDFAAAVFTNLGHDHLDYHPDERAYFEAKAKLFEGLGSEAWAVLGIDDPHAAELARRTPARVVGVGRGEDADVRVQDLALGLQGTRYRLVPRDGTPIEIESPLIGGHNALNLAQAAVAAHALGVDLSAAAEAAASLPGVPGRLQVVEDPAADLTVFVDYAHTDEALRQVLGFLREVGADPLACVVGCGGDRDRTKRARMAASAAELADSVVLTSDNPRTEDPCAILADMEAGIPASAEGKVRTFVDRREAIRYAILEAPPRATVLVAGKGHETRQILGKDAIHFDDAEEVRGALALRARRT